MRVGSELTWVLRGKNPEQVPMARLGEYLHQLAIMLGETQAVHFSRLEKGSTRIVAHVDAGEPSQRIHARAHAIRNRTAPKEALSAFERITDMVGEDKGIAYLEVGKSKVVRFTGRNELPSKSIRLVDVGSVTGRLYALSETSDGSVRGRVRTRGQPGYVLISGDRQHADLFRKHLFCAVRVKGRGEWARSKEGGWSCQHLGVIEINEVSEVSLRRAVDELRSVDANWRDDPIGDWVELDLKDETA